MSEHDIQGRGNPAPLPKVSLIVIGGKHTKQKYPNYDVLSSAAPSSLKDYINSCLAATPNTIVGILAGGLDLANEFVIDKVVQKFQQSNWTIKAIYGDVAGPKGLISYGQKYDRKPNFPIAPLFMLNVGGKPLETENIYDELLTKIGRLYIVYYYPEILFKHKDV